jgi:hypothetical protein
MQTLIKIMQEPQDLLTNELEITNTLKNYLSDVAKWAKFLSVIGLISCLVMVAGAFYAGYYVSHLPSYSFGSSMGQAITALYIFFAVIWFYPCLFLYKFSLKLMQALKSNSQEYIESAFINLRSAFKFLGIVTIVILSLWLLSFLFLVAKNLTG